MDKWLSTAMEISAGDLKDHLDDGTTNPVWTMRGYTQVIQSATDKIGDQLQTAITPLYLGLRQKLMIPSCIP